MSNKTEKPTNLRTDVMPKDGYVLSVDGKLKTRFESPEAATTAAVKLKQSYPVIQVKVFDAAARSYSLVTLPEQERDLAGRHVLQGAVAGTDEK